VIVIPDPAEFVPFERAALEQTIARRFAEQVERFPERLAVKVGSSGLTYAELDHRSSRIAAAILAGRRAEPVAVVIDQGLAVVPAILGVLKAGRIYVPLETALGAERLAFTLRDSCAGSVLVNGPTRALVESLAGYDVELIDADDLAEDLGVETSIKVSPDAPACIYYTTGSTGQPKGVVDSHRNVLHNVMRYTNTLRIGPNDRLTLLQSPSFSGAVSSMFCALLNGATSLPFDVRYAAGGDLADYVDHEGVTIYHSVPAIFRSFLRGDRVFSKVRVVRLEGDQSARVDVELFRRHFSAHCVLSNGLGTTETGLVRRFLLTGATPLSGEIVPIGDPVDDMEVMVVDASGAPVTAGEVGEIAVRSDYLALGYWNRPDLTERAFVADTSGRRTYRTGDLGRLRADGCLEHLGRKDSLVKIRGISVSLAMVEAALAALPGIREVAVAAPTDRHETRRLVAYYVAAAGAEPTAGELRRRLAERLPPEIIPSRFVQLDALPLNQNLKVDRAALPAVTGERPKLGQACVPPQDPTQAELVHIWEDLLDIHPIGIRDDFFDLGGDSLLATRIMTAIDEALGVEASPAILLAGSTIEHLAANLAGPSRPDAEVVQVQAGGSRTPLYFLHGDYLGRGIYCRKIARALGPEQPVFALTPCGLDGQPAPATIEEMATRHLRAMRRHRPRGPYRLVGNCNGGLVALEMARRLTAEGEAVEHVFVIRTSAENARFNDARRLIERVGRLLGISGAIQRDLVRRWQWFAREWRAAPPARRARLLGAKLIKLARVSRGPSAITPLDTAPAADRAALIGTFGDAAADYVPLPYGGKVVVFWPVEDPAPASAALKWWRRITPGAEVETIPGDHLTSITVHGDTFGRRLAARLGA
jgi:amino acid adenylation domain-containing protein